MNNKNLLYLNLAVDDEDVSLGFANTWIKQFSNKFENVDIITLNKSNENIGTNKKVNIYGLLKGDNTSRISKFLKIRKTIKELTSTTSYDLCFSHMSPLLLLMTKFYGLKNFLQYFGTPIQNLENSQKNCTYYEFIFLQQSCYRFKFLISLQIK